MILFKSVNGKTWVILVFVIDEWASSDIKTITINKIDVKDIRLNSNENTWPLKLDLLGLYDIIVITNAMPVMVLSDNSTYLETRSRGYADIPYITYL